MEIKQQADRTEEDNIETQNLRMLLVEQEGGHLKYMQALFKNYIFHVKAQFLH